MHGIVFIGVVATLAVFAILATIYARKPKKAEKWEKGEIIKQLLELSERENSSSVIAVSPARSPGSAPVSGTYSNGSRNGRAREPKSKRNDSAGSSAPPILSRRNQTGPNQADARTEEKIRQRAYQLYQERGGAGGSSTDDWLQAKQEVLSRKARAGSPSS